jgi:hypothetical protein
VKVGEEAVGKARAIAVSDVGKEIFTRDFRNRPTGHTEVNFAAWLTPTTGTWCKLIFLVIICSSSAGDRFRKFRLGYEFLVLITPQV